ncbi:conserved hypothetical protein [Theileria equi strain WA]|uniref:PRELI/MSF1 domain-containing protein n=1 Tax=Theileria equi strain WA TaxID=1537102 RepID=L1LD98_THEEQ|nr:conserved hypothetical protein [Theileria equi strain WA]EKX73306.1 conserved hypothetical protein [Theileria equi strain WA]|eukprot:XP_004832758.1 conserved hypothetical protein [Theileria equi strain WA]
MLSNSLKYDFDWETVVCGFWRRFPSKYHPYVNSVHTIGSKVNPEKKTLVVQRMYHIKYSFPYLIQKLIGSNVDYYILEESQVDLKTRKLSYQVKSVTPDYYSYSESACYQDSSNPGTTDFNCSMDVSISGFGVMNNTLEKLAEHRMLESMSKSNEFRAMVDSINTLNSL